MIPVVLTRTAGQSPLEEEDVRWWAVVPDRAKS